MKSQLRSVASRHEVKYEKYRKSSASLRLCVSDSEQASERFACKQHWQSRRFLNMCIQCIYV